MSGIQINNLLHLNDDCLREVLERLKIIDLVSVADVCSRLKEMGRAVVGSKYKIVEMVVHSVREINDCLRNFGQLIHSLRLKIGDGLDKSNYKYILKSLVRQCSGTLTYLEMHYFRFEKNNKAVVASQSLLNGVQKLVLIGCSVSVKWFVKCPELVELVLIDTHVTYHGLRYQTCPKLETLRIQGSLPWVKKGLNIFLQQNSQLKTLELLPFKQRPNDLVIPYMVLLESVPMSIERLTVATYCDNQLTRLQSLKTLQIKSTVVDSVLHHSIDCLVNATLEHLEIDANWFFMAKEHTTAISLFSRMKTLKFNICWFESDHMVDMIRNLHYLSELHVCSKVNNLGDSELFNLIRHGQNLQRLILTFFVNRKVNFPDMVVHSWHEHGQLLQMNAKFYQKMLNLVLRRSNGKSLDIFIVGHEHEITLIDAAFPTNAALKITCWSLATVSRILRMDASELRNGNIKITDENLKVLCNRGPCPRN